MIRRATNEEYNKVISYLDNEGGLNTTLLAHIEKYGFEKDFQDIWLHEDETKVIPLAIVMRHFNNLYIYGRGYSFEEKASEHIEELASFLSFLGHGIISGEMKLLRNLSVYLNDMFLEPSYHMELGLPCSLTQYPEVKRASLEDCEELSVLIYSIPEFARFYHSPLEIERGIRRRIEMGICRYFLIKQDNIIVSQAYTTIEASKYATIGGVVTRPEYRKQGFASRVVSGICQDIINDNKIPNLFYTNKEAGRVYEQLGFVQKKEYAMLLSKEYAVYKEQI